MAKNGQQVERDVDLSDLSELDLSDLSELDLSDLDAKRATGPMESFVHGLQSSSGGLVVRGQLPEKQAPQGFADSTAAAAGTMLGDLPVSLVGAVVGTGAGVLTGPAAVISGTGGAFAAPGMVRHALTEQYTNGSPSDITELAQRVLGTLWEGAKDYSIGAAGGAVGLGVVGKAGRAALTSGGKLTTSQVARQLPAEAVTQSIGMSLEEGKLPTVEDVTLNTAMALTAHVAARVGGKASSSFRNVINKAKNDPATSKLANEIGAMANEAEAQKAAQALADAEARAEAVATVDPNAVRAADDPNLGSFSNEKLGIAYLTMHKRMKQAEKRGDVPSVISTSADIDGILQELALRGFETSDKLSLLIDRLYADSKGDVRTRSSAVVRRELNETRKKVSEIVSDDLLSSKTPDELAMQFPERATELRKLPRLVEELQRAQHAENQHMQSVEALTNPGPDGVVPQASLGARISAEVDAIIEANMTGGLFNKQRAAELKRRRATHPSNQNGSEAGPNVAAQQLRPDIWALTRKLMSPERAGLSASQRRRGVVVGDPVQDASARIVQAELHHGQRMAEYYITHHDLFAKLSDAEKLAVRPLVDLMYKDPQRAQTFAERNPNLYRAAQGTVSWFNGMKTEIKDYMRKKLISSMDPETVEIFDAAVAAESPAARALLYAERGLDEKQAASMAQKVAKYVAINKWGLEDFITNIELGSYRVTRDGKTVAVGETRKLAQGKLDALRAETPGTYRIETDAVRPPNPLVRRKDKLRGEADITKSLPVYADRVLRKILYDPIETELLKQMRADEATFRPEIRKLLLNQLTDAKGRRTFGAQVVDFVAQKLGQRTGLYQSGLGRARSVIGNLALGYRPIGGLVNAATGYGKVFVKHGIGLMRDARRFLDSTDGKRFIAEEERLGSLGVNVAIDFDTGKVSPNVKPWHPLWFFSKAEPGIRRMNIAAAYLEGRRMGMADEAAREYGRRMLRLTNFTYNLSALPEIMRSPLGRTAFQMKSYLANELMFAHTLAPAQWAKYLTFQLAMAGPRAFVMLGRTLPILGAVGLWDKIEEGLNDNALYRGLPGLVGVDITPSFAMQLPQTPEDAAGLLFGHAMRLYKDVISPQIAGVKYGSDRMLSWLDNLSPLAYHWGNLWDAVENDGWVLNERGERMYQMNDTHEKVMSALAVTPLGVSKSRVVERALKSEQELGTKNRAAVVSRFIRAVNRPDTTDRSIIDVFRGAKEEIPADLVQEAYTLWRDEGKIGADLAADIISLGISPESLQQAARLSRMSASERAVAKARLLDKVRALQAFEGLEE